MYRHLFISDTPSFFYALSILFFSTLVKSCDTYNLAILTELNSIKFF